MDSEKVTLAQAAGQVGVHINTIKTWRRSGYLKSAELIIEHGVEVWHVSLEEAIQVAQSKRNKRVDSSKNTGGYPAGYTDNNSVMAENNNPAPASGGQLLARPEQAMLELITQTQKPLLEMLNSRDTTIQELTAELATVKERLRALEAAQAQVAQKIQQPAVATKLAEPLPAPTPEPIKERRVFGFFKRKPKA